MAKKNLAALMSGIMGEKRQDSPAPSVASPAPSAAATPTTPTPATTSPAPPATSPAPPATNENLDVESEHIAETDGQINSEATSAPPEVTDDMKAQLEVKRRRNVGRPRKGEPAPKSDEIRATFIVNPEQVRRIKYISLVENSLLKDVIAQALGEYIANWETANGKIRLPKSRL